MNLTLLYLHCTVVHPWINIGNWLARMPMTRFKEFHHYHLEGSYVTRARGINVEKSINNLSTTSRALLISAAKSNR